MSTDKVDAREAWALGAVTLPELLKFAALGKVAMRFVDRAGDVHPGIDDAETICSEFHQAISDEVNRQAAAQEGK